MPPGCGPPLRSAPLLPPVTKAFIVLRGLGTGAHGALLLQHTQALAHMWPALCSQPLCHAAYIFCALCVRMKKSLFAHGYLPETV